MYNKFFMDKAIETAKNAENDIPVAAIITKDNKIISIQTNQKEKLNQATFHAEILALQEANKFLNNWRLDDCEMYVTLEPCPMCAAAIIQARIKNLYFGSYDIQYGGFTKLNLDKVMQSKINIKGGIEEKRCDNILKEYFERIRNEKTSG